MESPPEVVELLDTLDAIARSLDRSELVDRSLRAVARLLGRSVALIDAHGHTLAACTGETLVFAGAEPPAPALMIELRDGSHTHGLLAVAADPPDPPRRVLETLGRSLARALAHAERFAEQRDAAERSRELLDNTPAVVFVKDLDGRYTLVNHQLELDTGLERAQILGKDDYQLFDRATAERLRADDRKVLDNGQTLEFEGVTRFPSGDRTFLTSKFPLRDRDGHITGLGAVSTDITERKRIEAQALHSQKLEALGRLAGGIAHDFNNILTSIVASTELIERLQPREPAPAIAEALARITDSSDRAAGLARKLLVFCGEAHRPTQLVDVHERLTAAVAQLRPKLAAGIRVELALDASHPHVLGDPAGLEATIVELVANAKDALANGGRLIVATRDHREGDDKWVEISVQDDGAGMDESTLARMFEPFFSTKAGGSGLGLAAVHGTIAEHRGTIQIVSRVGQGTCVTLRLPETIETIEAIETIEPAETTETTEASPAAAETPRNLVLLVDDEPVLRKTGGRMLEAMGYRVVVAADGREGVRAYEQHHHELRFVLLDMVMPVMGGAAAFEAMREIDEGVPIIACSGYAADAAVRTMQAHGLAGFLPKPYRVTQLDQLLGRAASH